MTQEIMMVVEQPHPIVMQTTEFVRSGLTDYDTLTNKPAINGVTLDGDKSTAELGLPSSAADVGAVAANQGSENAGKFLTVANDGSVQPTAISTWQAGNY